MKTITRESFRPALCNLWKLKPYHTQCVNSVFKLSMQEFLKGSNVSYCHCRLVYHLCYLVWVKSIVRYIGSFGYLRPFCNLTQWFAPGKHWCALYAGLCMVSELVWKLCVGGFFVSILSVICSGKVQWEKCGCGWFIMLYVCKYWLFLKLWLELQCMSDHLIWRTCRSGSVVRGGGGDWLDDLSFDLKPNLLTFFSLLLNMYTSNLYIIIDSATPWYL